MNQFDTMTPSKFSLLSLLFAPSSALETTKPAAHRGGFAGSELNRKSDPPPFLPDIRTAQRAAMASRDGRTGAFDLEQARLMARFSSVAYENPPKQKARDVVQGVVQFTDEHGVSITRPVSQCDSQKRPDCDEEEETESGTWKMAHSDAAPSPRPLMLMLSGCDGTASGLSEKAQFRWVALATSQNTSAQFDAWRISTVKNATTATDDEKEGDAILVIAFRGTRVTSFLDLLTDIQLKQDLIRCSDFGVCTDGEEDLPTSREKRCGDDNDNDSEIKVHSGFLSAYTSIRSSLLRLLVDNAGTYDRICFTGHSLGAAMSSLALLDVGLITGSKSRSVAVALTSPSSSSSQTQNKQTLTLPKAKLSAYLFGTPRVGNRAFAERLWQLQHQPKPIVQECYRVNTPGDAVVFLPRGKVANRLDIDYVHAGASVFLPALSENSDKSEKSNGKSGRMMRLEEDTIERINTRILGGDGNGASTNVRPANATGTAKIHVDEVGDNPLSKIRIFPGGDQPPDPLSEVDPGYSGFFPTDPRTWFSFNFQNFVLGETVRAFRILRGGFVKNHRLQTYEEGLWCASHGDIVVLDPLK